MENKYYRYQYNTPFGDLIIKENGKEIVEISIINNKNVKGNPKEVQNECIEKETEIIKKAKKQLFEYFEGKRTQFELPLNPKGTEFQKKVWKALMDIPYGETRTYKQIAEVAGCPKGARAVGLANNKNNIVIVIPCHRVIGANGTLVGYGGGLELKRQLLNIEGIVINK